MAFDLPAVFDFVYGKAGQKINYVGHSQVRINTFVLYMHFWRANLSTAKMLLFYDRKIMSSSPKNNLFTM